MVDYQDGPEFTWLLTGLSTSFYNNVLGTRLTEETVTQRLREVLDSFAAKQVRYLSWWVEADAQPPQLGGYLEALGLTYLEGMPGMAVDLEQMDPALASVSGLSIKHVTNQKDLRQWTDTLLSGFDLPLRESEACCELYLPLGFDLPLRHYLGIWNGRPVATSQLFLGEGVAGMYCVATIPEARRHGIGAAMSMKPMLEAREIGYRIGTLQASPLGAPVYQRMGFRKHAQFSHYYLAP
jgi:GNAT superfamily N-acetyltransferase